jgi:hypothetical protein
LICWGDVVLISTTRFFLRTLTVADVSERYLSWLEEGQAQRFINGAKCENDMDSLRTYVAQRETRDDILFLGIFAHDGTHIGNIKYEPIDSASAVAVVGILITSAYTRLFWGWTATITPVFALTRNWALLKRFILWCQ